jgi:hypothetical protein
LKKLKSQRNKDFFLYSRFFKSKLDLAAEAEAANSQTEDSEMETLYCEEIDTVESETEVHQKLKLYNELLGVSEEDALNSYPRFVRLYIGEKHQSEICFLDEGAQTTYCLRSLLDDLVKGKDYLWLKEDALLVSYNGHPSKARKIKIHLSDGKKSIYPHIYVVDDVMTKNKSKLRLGIDVQSKIGIRKYIPKHLLGYSIEETDQSDIQFHEPSVPKAADLESNPAAKRLLRKIRKLLKMNSKIHTPLLEAPLLPFSKEIRKNGIHTEQYPLPSIYADFLKKDNDQKIANGQIREALDTDSLLAQSNSPVWIASRGTKIRRVDNLRRLNKHLPNLSNTLPKIVSLMAKLGKINGKFYCIIDLKDGFHNILIHPSDRPILGFTDADGRRFEWLTLPQGLKVSSTIFHSIIEKVIRPHSQFCFNYVDDLIVCGETAEEVLENALKVLKTLTENHLKVNAEKIKLAVNEFDFLGHTIVSTDKGLIIKPDAKKIIHMQNMPRPKTLKEVQQLFGMMNYLRQYIPRFSHLLYPIIQLLKHARKDKYVKWKGKHEECFKNFIEILKHQMSQLHQDMLRYSPSDVDIFLSTDASTRGIGGCLSFRTKDGDEKVISFNSRTLTESEMKYTVPKLEMLSIIYNLDFYKHLLVGRRFTIRCDSQICCHLLASINEKKSNLFLNNWLNQLQNYDFSIEHISSRRNIIPDVLSRFYPHEKEYSVESVSIEIQRLARSSKKKDMVKLIKKIHDTNHFGINLTYYFIKTVLNLSVPLRLVQEVVKGCKRCNAYSTPPFMLRKAFKHFTSQYPLQRIVGDVLFLTENTNGRAVIVFVDLFTRFTFLYPISSFSAEATANVLLSLFSNWGIPEETLFDQGTNFLNQLNLELSEKLMFSPFFTLTGDHQANGVSERQCRTVLESVLKNLNSVDWTDSIDLIQFSLNCRPISKLGNITPFELMYGRPPFTRKAQSKYKSYSKTMKVVLRNWKYLNKYIFPKVVELHNVHPTDPKKRVSNLFPGDAVVIRNRKKSTKMDKRWFGPLKVVEIIHNEVVTEDANGISMGSYSMPDTKKVLLQKGERVLTQFEFESSKLENSEIEKEPVDEEYIPTEQSPLRKFNSVKSKKKTLNSTFKAGRREIKVNSTNSSSNNSNSSSPSGLESRNTRKKRSSNNTSHAGVLSRISKSPTKLKLVSERFRNEIKNLIESGAKRKRTQTKK